MLQHHARGGGVVHDDGSRDFSDAAQHGIREIALIESRPGTSPPHFARQKAMPLAVVVNKFFDVFLFVERSQEKMLQHRIV